MEFYVGENFFSWHMKVRVILACMLNNSRVEYHILGERIFIVNKRERGFEENRDVICDEHKEQVRNGENKPTKNSEDWYGSSIHHTALSRVREIIWTEVDHESFSEQERRERDRYERNSDEETSLW